MRSLRCNAGLPPLRRGCPSFIRAARQAEGKAGVSRTALAIVRVASKFIALTGQDRYRHEWIAELEEMQRQGIAQFRPAVRILLGAPAVGRTLRRPGQRHGIGERLAAAAYYDAFMSYSPLGDRQFAGRLHRDIERFAKPWHRLRGNRLFRDQLNLATSPPPWDAIMAALAKSRWFILLASPESAQSEWVSAEVRYWLEKKNLNRILIAVTAGNVVWDVQARDFAWERTTAVPADLAGVFPDEPLWIDLRALPRDPWSSLPSDAIASFVALLRELPKDVLIGRLSRQARRRHAAGRGLHGYHLLPSRRVRVCNPGSSSSPVRRAA
jgi:TIR domain